MIEPCGKPFWFNLRYDHVKEIVPVSLSTLFYRHLKEVWRRHLWPSIYNLSHCWSNVDTKRASKRRQVCHHRLSKRRHIDYLSQLILTQLSFATHWSRLWIFARSVLCHGDCSSRGLHENVSLDLSTSNIYCLDWAVRSFEVASTWDFQSFNFTPIHGFQL